MSGQKFPKTERLCGLKLISSLFEEGETFYIKGYKVIIKEVSVTEDVPIKIAFAVPKKSFKKAVDRNLIRRRMREAFRKAKEPLFDVLKLNGKQLAIMVIYLGKEIDTYTDVENSISTMIKFIVNRISVS